MRYPAAWPVSYLVKAPQSRYWPNRGRCFGDEYPPEEETGPHANLTITVIGSGEVGVNPDYARYNHGTQVELSAAWDDSTHRFSGWNGDGTCSGTYAVCRFSVSGSASIVATFVRGPTGEPTSQPTATSTPTPEPEDCTLTVTSGPGGTTLGGGTIPCGSGHLAAGAFRNACHDFTGWSGDHSGSNALIAVEMDSDKSVHAGFAHDGSTRTLTVQPSPAEAASRNTSMHRCGAEVTPTHPTANACWVASGTLSEVTMTGDRTVTADYDPSGERFTLTVRASPSEGGSTTGSGTYDCGTVVTATATANDGWRLVSWSPAARVRMTRSGSVTAHFERTTPPPPPSTYSLTVTETGCCGSVSVSPSGPYYQGDNTSVTLTATPSPDLPSGPSFSFDGWSGDCSGRSSTCTLTMDDDKSVTATFSNSCDGNTGIGCRRQEEGGEGDGEPPPPAP